MTVATVDLPDDSDGDAFLVWTLAFATTAQLEAAAAALLTSIAGRGADLARVLQQAQDNVSLGHQFVGGVDVRHA